MTPAPTGFLAAAAGERHLPGARRGAAESGESGRPGSRPRPGPGPWRTWVHPSPDGRLGTLLFSLAAEMIEVLGGLSPPRPFLCRLPLA